MPRKTPERDIQSAATAFLALDGWRAINTDPPRLRGLGVQEKGIADMLYLRYGDFDAAGDDLLGEACCSHMFIEWKAPKGVLSSHQAAWHLAEHARGGLTLIAGHDFPKSYEGFLDWYRKSGLLRKAGL